jgi:hypothetical protein
MISNLRYPKVFLFNPSTELVAVNTAKPQDLTFGQVGFYNAKTGVGCTTTPTNVSCPVLQIHQNLGDNKFGTTRTRDISVQRVRKWYAQKAAVAVQQVTYVGYDEVVGTKNLVAFKGQQVNLVINLFNNDLSRWYGPRGYFVSLPLDIAVCNPCVADCEQLDPDDIADFYVALINGTNASATNFPAGMELQNYVLASKVATGTQGNVNRRVGIKIVTVSQGIELIKANEPQQKYNARLTTFTVGIPGNCPNFPITTTVKAVTGCGFPLEALELEKESQGYDRVRDAMEDSQYLLPNYITRAADGVKYDFYFLEFQSGHADSGIPKEIVDPYIVVFIVPTGTGAALQTLINGWLTPLGFDAVTIAASTGKGSGIPQVNA